MILVGRSKLCRLTRDGGQAERWVRSWVAELASAHWRHLSDIYAQFPSARQVADGCIAFPVSDSDAVIQVRVAFPQGVALITALIDGDDTHGS